MALKYFDLQDEVIAQLPQRTERKLSFGEKWDDKIISKTNHPSQLEEARRDLCAAMMYTRVANLDASENVKNASEALEVVYLRFYAHGEHAAAVLIEEDKASITKAFDARLGQQRGI